MDTPNLFSKVRSLFFIFKKGQGRPPPLPPPSSCAPAGIVENLFPLRLAPRPKVSKSEKSCGFVIDKIASSNGAVLDIGFSSDD